MIRITYRWFDLPLGAALVFFSVVRATVAEPIYKCRDDQGNIAFQGQHCSALQREESVVLRSVIPQPEKTQRSAPALQPAEPQPMQRARRARSSATGAAAVPISYECRTDNGEVFYRHTSCPAALTTNTDSHRNSRRQTRLGAKTHAVSARKIPRAEACKNIHAASASDRVGYAYDEQISTYDRNLGKDPCG